MRITTFTRCFALVLALLCLLKTGKAQQMSITWPKDGAVFQQDDNGKADVVFLGYFNSRSFRLGRYSVTATLEKLRVQDGSVIGVERVVTLSSTLSTILGYRLTAVDKGWYRLTVQGAGTPSNSGLPVI